jgi:phage shock protein C
MNEKRLVRSQNDRMIAGVAAGLAEYMNIDPTIVRLLFVLLALAGGGGGLIYIIMWLIMPEA